MNGLATFHQSANDRGMVSRTHIAAGKFVAKYLLAYCMALSAWPAAAAVQVTPLFSDNMVIQRQAEVPIWGNAKPGEEIMISARNHTTVVRAGADGRWMARLPSMEAIEEPVTISRSPERQTPSPSRMCWSATCGFAPANRTCKSRLDRGPDNDRCLNYEQEIAEANYPTIRLFNVEERLAFAPQSTCRGRWEVCSPKTAGTFSAAAYFFARQLVRDNHVPIGLITASVGGTFAQAWTSLPALKNAPTIPGHRRSRRRTRHLRSYGQTPWR